MSPRKRHKTSFTGRAAVLAVVLAALAIALAGPLRELLAQRTQISSLRSDAAKQAEELKALQQQQKLWADPSYVEQQARDRLHYVRAGQVPYVTLSPTPSATASPNGSVGASGPWYAQLWLSVRSADAPATPLPTPAPTP